MAYLSVCILGLLLFFFIFWKKLKEDYPQEQIFSISFMVTFTVTISYLISRFFLPLWWFWIGLVGLLIGFFAGYLKYRFMLYEFMDSLVISIMPFLALIFITNAVLAENLSSLIAFGITLGTIVLYFILSKNYRQFTWYRSGRVGFAGLTTAGVMFLLRGIFAFFFPNVISFVGGFEAILSGVMAFIIFLMLYNLSRL